MKKIYSSSKYSLINKIKDDKYFKTETLKYDFETNLWKDLPVENLDIIINNQLSFITYNVWFERHNWKNRLNELYNIFSKHEPDFICLQEVTYDFLNFLLSQDIVRKKYYVSGNFKGGYDVLMLSKYCVNYYYIEFPTNMGRKLLLSEIGIELGENYLENIFISTTHLESLSNSDYRKSQLEICFELLNISNMSYLMGDFNFDSTWEEEINIDENYLDCWNIYKEYNGLDDEEGYTMPKNSYFPAWRPDRIIFSDRFKIFKLNSFKIIGKNKIDQDQINNLVLTPSDHYGLYVCININI